MNKIIGFLCIVVSFLIAYGVYSGKYLTDFLGKILSAPIWYIIAVIFFIAGVILFFKKRRFKATY